MKFVQKTVLCNVEDLHKTIEQVRFEWLTALLLRAQVDRVMIDRLRSDETMSGQVWRDHLVVDKWINVIKDGDSVVVEKHFEERPKKELGRWDRPEIVRVNEFGKHHVELRLKYSQLV